MLKKRLVALLVVKNGIVVQSIGFRKYLPVGSPLIAVEFLNNWGIDEIIMLDISATPEGREPDFDLVKKVSKKCFVPLTVGGGVRNLDDMRKLIHFGADKISINHIALKKPEIISEASYVFGSQSIVVSIDVRAVGRHNYEVFYESMAESTHKNPVDWSREVERLGAGEILLTSIDRDGSKSGYDIELIKMVSKSVEIPVIACGGVGHPDHMLEGIVSGSASAVAAGNFFHFTEHSAITAKAYIQRHHSETRLDSYAQYKGFNFSEAGRLAKKEERYLEKLRFEYQPEEVI